MKQDMGAFTSRWRAWQRLRLADGSPVRAASAVIPLGDGFLVVQDYTTNCA